MALQTQSGEPYKLYHVDVPPGKGLGVDIQWRRIEPAGYETTAIATAGDPFILQWNKRSAETVPADVIRVGDIIVRVNKARTRKEVAKMLNQPELEWILVIARLEVFQ